MKDFEPSFSIESLEEFTSLIEINNFDEEKLLEHYNNKPASKAKSIDGKEITFPKLTIEQNKHWIELCKSAIHLNPKKIYSLDLKKVLYEIDENSSFSGDRYFKHLDINSNALIISSLKVAVEKMNNKSKLRAKELANKEKELQENISFKKFKEKIEKHYNNAKLFHKTEKYPQAIYSFTQALLLDKFHKSDLDILFARSLSKFEVSDFIGCLNDIDESIKIKEETIDKKYQRGICNYKLKQFAKALIDFTSVLKENNRNEKAYYFRGLCHIKLKNKAEGCMDLSKSGELGYFLAYEKIKKHCK